MLIKNKLLEEIHVLENIDNINSELLDEKRKELYDVRKVKMEGVKVRYKSRWINDGERLQNIFVIWKTEIIPVNVWIV